MLGALTVIGCTCITTHTPLLALLKPNIQHFADNKNLAAILIKLLANYKYLPVTCTQN